MKFNFSESLFGDLPLDELRVSPIGRMLKSNVEEKYSREYELDVYLDVKRDEIINTNAIFIRGDKNTSILNIKVWKNNSLFNLSGVTVTANVKEARNETITIPVEVVDINGCLKINIPSNVTDEYGTNIFELVFQKDDKIIISQKYSYAIYDSIGEGVNHDEQEITVLQALIRDVQTAKNTVDTITEELEVTQTDIDDILEMVGGL